MPGDQMPELGAIGRKGDNGLGIGDEGPRDPLPVELVETENAERVGALPRDDGLDVCRFGLPARLAHPVKPLLVSTPQISLAYCRIVRSEENHPMWAVFLIAIEYHLRFCCQSVSTLAC